MPGPELPPPRPFRSAATVHSAPDAPRARAPASSRASAPLRPCGPLRPTPRAAPGRPAPPGPRSRSALAPSPPASMRRCRRHRRRPVRPPALSPAAREQAPPWRGPPAPPVQRRGVGRRREGPHGVGRRAHLLRDRCELRVDRRVLGQRVPERHHRQARFPRLRRAPARLAPGLAAAQPRANACRTRRTRSQAGAALQPARVGPLDVRPKSNRPAAAGAGAARTSCSASSASIAAATSSQSLSSTTRWLMRSLPATTWARNVPEQFTVLEICCPPTSLRSRHGLLPHPAHHLRVRPRPKAVERTALANKHTSAIPSCLRFRIFQNRSHLRGLD